MTIMSPTRRFSVGTCPLMPLWSSLRYSPFHRVRNCWWKDFKCCHQFRMDLDSPFTSGSTMGTRKCPGVNAKRSVGSSEMGDSGLEFRQASIFAWSFWYQLLIGRPYGVPQEEWIARWAIGHRFLSGLQKVSGKHGGSADDGISIVGLDLARTLSSRYETSKGGKKLFSR